MVTICGIAFEQKIEVIRTHTQLDSLIHLAEKTVMPVFQAFIGPC